jgi:hypothetical protein
MRTGIAQGVVCLAIIGGAAACSGSDLTLPRDNAPARLRAFSGSGQEATAGSPLPHPLVVHLTDRDSQPVPEALIAFRFEEEIPGAQLSRPSITTNEDGIASVEARLGTTVGPQTIEARLANGSLSTTFVVTALPPGGDGDGDGDGDGHGGGGGRGRGGDNDD